MVNVQGNKGDTKYKWMEQPIGLEELFANRAVLVDQGKQHIGYVLLTGEAGAGKSTLVRKLAYIWARGDGLRDVLIVYILQVGKLLASRYHGQSDCFHAETLATAILQENCPHAVDGKEVFVQLRKLVE